MKHLKTKFSFHFLYKNNNNKKNEPSQYIQIKRMDNKNSKKLKIKKKILLVFPSLTNQLNHIYIIFKQEDGKDFPQYNTYNFPYDFPFGSITFPSGSTHSTGVRIPRQEMVNEFTGLDVTAVVDTGPR